MRDFAKISTSIWGSRKFRSLPSDDARLVYLYLHTCPHVNSLGCFVLPFGYALSDLGWNDIETDLKRYRNCIDSLCHSGLIGFDKTENLVRIVDFLKHSPFTNEKHAKGAIKLVSGLPECEEKTFLINNLRGMRFVSEETIPADIDTVSIAYRYTETETETETRDREEGGGGGAGAPEFPLTADAPTFRERILAAMGIGPDGIAGPSKIIGGQGDMAEASRWLEMPGITEAAVCDEIRRIVASKRDGPPSGFGYFTKPMQRLSAQLSAPPLQPIAAQGTRHDRATASDRREAAAADRLRSRLYAAARVD